MEFLYIFSVIFLSLFGLVMLVKTAAEALFGNGRAEKRRDSLSDMGVKQKRR